MNRPLDLAVPAGRLRRSAAALMLAGGLAAPVAVAATPAGADTAPCALPADTVAPLLHNLTLTPAKVDVSKGPGSIGVSVEATDSSATGIPSGVADVLVVVTGPNGSQTFGTAALLHRVSGSPADGIWNGQLRLPRYAPAGTYKVAEAAAFDVVGNLQAYSDNSSGFAMGGSSGFFVVTSGAGPLLARVEMHERLDHATATAHVAAATGSSSTAPAGSPTDPSLQPGWQPQVTVTSARPPHHGGSGSGPVRVGKLTGFTARPEIVNTRHSARRIRVRAHFSGPQPRFAEAFLDDVQAGPDPQFAIMMLRHRRSFAGSMRVPTWAGRESFHITLYAGYAGRGGGQRLRAWSPDQLAAAGYSHVVHVVSGVDRTSPTISGLTVTPDPIDSRAGRVNGTVTVTASDRPSGVKAVYVRFYKLFYGQGFEISEDVKLLTLHRAGSDWTAPFSVGQCAAGGPWRIEAVAVDRAGNYRDLPSYQLSKAGLPSSVKVRTAAGDRTPPTVSDITTRGHVVTVDFSEPVRNVTPQNLSLYAMRPAADRYDAVTPIDGVTCYDSAGNAEADCTGGTTPVSSVDLTVNGLESNMRYQVWANQLSVTPQLTDVAGNPMDWLNLGYAFTAS